MRVLGRRWVVEACGDGVGLGDLAVGVAHEVGLGAVEDADLSVVDGCAVLAGVEAEAAGFCADKFYAVFVDEVGEHTDGVGAAAHACGHNVGKASGAFEHLGFCFFGDDAVEVFDDAREWVWSCRGSQEVVGGVEGCGPVA